MDFYQAISSNRIMKAIRQGLVTMTPLFIIGSFAVLLNNLPIPQFQEFMTQWFGEEWKNFGVSIYNGTIQIMSLGIIFSISFSLAKVQSSINLKHINAITVAIVSLGCFITITNVQDNALKFSQLGVMGLFDAILVAVLSSELFFFFCKRRIIKTKIHAAETDSLFTQSLSTLEPAILTFIFFCIMKAVFSFFGITDIHEFIYSMLEAIFIPLRQGLFAAIVFKFFSQFFWFLGIHGSYALENVMSTLWVPLLDVNIQAVNAGNVPSEIFTKPFFDVYTSIGGSGSTLCLIIALLIASNTSSTSKLGKMSLPLALFNINETMVFGLPIVLNPFYILPFLLIPILQLLIAYTATVLHLVPVVVHSVPWTTPVIIGGYWATGSISGSILQIINLTVGVLIYIPFVKMNENAKFKSNQKILLQLNDEIGYTRNESTKTIDRQDEIGVFARMLADDLEHALAAGNELYMVFQPQMMNDGITFGCETLLRWKHKKYGMIPPPTTIKLAEESGIDGPLNEWIFEQALEAQRLFVEKGFGNCVISINISPLQLKNEKIFRILEKRITEYALNPDRIEIELTENIAINTTDLAYLSRLKKLGCRLAIDDFGMGHTSLQYLRTYDFNIVKLDGSLVRDILTDKNSADIAKSIIALATNLNMDVVAEVVETQEQCETLCAFGCRIFQGYHFSKPLEKADYLAFLENNPH